MRKVILFIAMSLDGYIADTDGKVDWLAGQQPGRDDMRSYSEFIKNVSTIIMGWNTYHQIATELSPQEWYYHGLKSYVITHKEMDETEEIIFSNEPVYDLIMELKQNNEKKDIWICGGADIVRQFMVKGCIDIYHISVIPTILGNGISLFSNLDSETKLKLIKTQSYNGITDLIYENR